MRGILFCGLGMLCLLGAAGPARGDTFHRNGYDLRLETRQEGNDLLLTGRIEGGAPCRKLRVETRVSSDRGEKKRFVIRIPEVGGIYSRLLEKRLRVKKPGQIWTIEQVDLQCEER